MRFCNLCSSCEFIGLDRKSLQQQPKGAIFGSCWKTYPPFAQDFVIETRLKNFLNPFFYKFVWWTIEIVEGKCSSDEVTQWHWHWKWSSLWYSVNLYPTTWYVLGECTLYKPRRWLTDILLAKFNFYSCNILYESYTLSIDRSNSISSQTQLHDMCWASVQVEVVAGWRLTGENLLKVLKHLVWVKYFYQSISNKSWASVQVEVVAQWRLTG